MIEVIRSYKKTVLKKHENSCCCHICYKAKILLSK